VGTGMFSSFQEAVASMVKKGRTFTADPANHRIYQALYKEVYLQTYKALDPLYRKVARITGYPTMRK